MAGGSIKLFQFLQKYCQTFRVYPPQANQNQYHINAINWFHLFCLDQYLATTAAFLSFEANSMAEYSKSFFACLTIVTVNVWCLAAFWQAKNIPRFIGNWEEFIEKRLQLAMAFKKANEKIERATALLAYYWVVSLSFPIISALIYTFVNYYILDRGDESFFLNVPAWWPFNWKTPLGYFVAWACQSAGMVAMLTIFALLICFILASCLLFMSMAENIAKNLNTFNSNLRSSEDRDGNHVNLMNRFCALIQIYSDAKQCVNEFNEICEYLLLTFFSWDMMSVSSLLVTLQFQLLDDDSNLGEIFFTSLLIFYIFGLIFLICELGERVTSHFELFGQELERCGWHLLSIELQRMYLIFLSDVQQPVNIRSYAGIKCSRETFKTITNKGFSYFAMLRQFEV